MQKTLLFFLVLALLSCKKDPVSPAPSGNTAYYYPPKDTDAWETVNPASLGWDVAALNNALEFAKSKNTGALIILHKGRIVTEQYWQGWDMNKKYFIASAGKSVIGLLIGVAQEEKLLRIDQPTSDFLGQGWTSAPADKEKLITIRHQLTMTSGLNDNLPATAAVPEPDNCLKPECLKYLKDAGQRWAYHNAPYRLLEEVIEKTSGMSINAYSKTRLYDKTGMKNSLWYNHVMWATGRDMARFGLLILSKGSWNGEKVIRDEQYFSDMTGTSQSLNKSYGYLWWLNGKGTHMLPQTQLVFNSDLVPTAPKDMIMALGKDDKKIYVIPGKDLVVIRHGESSGETLLALSSFDTQLWEKLSKAIK